VAAACPAAGQCHQETNMITITDKEQGMSVEITPVPATVYQLVFRDTDSGQVIATRVFLTEEQAIAFGNTLLK